MWCTACGTQNPEGNRFCSSCGRLLGTASGAVVTAAAAGGSAVAARPGAAPGARAAPGGGSVGSFLAEWRALLTSGGPVLNRVLAVAGIALLIYSLIMGQPILVLLTLALGWAMRKVVDQLDAPLAPFWAIRNVIPGPLRLIMGWVAPIVMVGWLLVWPPFAPWVSGLPWLRTESWSFLIITAVSAVVAYVFIREPAQQPAR